MSSRAAMNLEQPQHEQPIKGKSATANATIVLGSVDIIKQPASSIPPPLFGDEKKTKVSNNPQQKTTLTNIDANKLSKTQFMNKCDVGPLTYYDLALFQDEEAHNQNAVEQKPIIETLQIKQRHSFFEKLKSSLSSLPEKSNAILSHARHGLAPALFQLVLKSKKAALLVYDNTADKVESAFRMFKDKISNTRSRKQ